MVDGVQRRLEGQHREDRDERQGQDLAPRGPQEQERGGERRGDGQHEQRRCGRRVGVVRVLGGQPVADQAQEGAAEAGGEETDCCSAVHPAGILAPWSPAGQVGRAGHAGGRLRFTASGLVESAPM
jgi:hypothetical protein